VVVKVWLSRCGVICSLCSLECSVLMPQSAEWVVILCPTLWAGCYRAKAYRISSVCDCRSYFVSCVCVAIDIGMGWKKSQHIRLLRRWQVFKEENSNSRDMTKSPTHCLKNNSMGELAL